MHRSASSSRVSDDYYLHGSSPKALPSTGMTKAQSFIDTSEQLPLHDPLSEASKRERARLKRAENAVHIIPLALFLCIFILWFVSSNPDVDVEGNKTDPSIAARIEGLTMDGDLDINESDTALAGMETAGLDAPIKEDGDKKTTRDSEENIFN